MARKPVMIFIDGSNLYHSLRDEYERIDLDFEKFYERLAGNRELVRAYYYNAEVDEEREPQRHEEQARFFERMRRVPRLEVKLGRLVYGRGGPDAQPYEKGIDVGIATDMLVHAFRQHFDTAILVSGDTDFVDAIQAVKDFGLHVEVALFGPRDSSHRLRDVADQVIDLDDRLLEACWQ